MSSKSATTTPISTIHITTSQSRSVPWTTTNQATTALTTYSAANTTHSSTLFTTSVPRTTNQATTVLTSYSAANTTHSSTLFTTSVPRTTNQATTVPTTYSATNMTHSSTLFITTVPITTNQATTVPTTYSTINMTHSSILFTTSEPRTTNQVTTVPTTNSATNMTHSSTLFITTVPITTNQATTVPTTYSAINMTHSSTLFTTTVPKTSNQATTVPTTYNAINMTHSSALFTTAALRTTTQAITTSTNRINFESIYSTTATITPTNTMSTSAIKITGQPSTTAQYTPFNNSLTTIVSTFTTIHPTKKTSVANIESQTNAESASSQSATSLDTTILRISSNKMYNNITSILENPTVKTTATTDTITVPPIEHTDVLITSTMLIETGVSNKTSVAETSVAYKYTDNLDIVTESSIVLTKKTAISTQYHTQVDIFSIHTDTAVAILSVSSAAAILSVSSKMDKALLTPTNVSVRCCCQCCTNFPPSTCQFCSDLTTKDAAICASKIPEPKFPEPYKSEYVRGTANFQTPEPLIGSSFPARLAYNPDFEASEIFTEKFASMSDMTRNSIGYSLNDLILNCEYDNAPCNMER